MALKGTVTGKQLLSSQVNLSGCHMREVLFIVSIYFLSIGISHRLNIMYVYFLALHLISVII